MDNNLSNFLTLNNLTYILLEILQMRHLLQVREEMEYQEFLQHFLLYWVQEQVLKH